MATKKLTSKDKILEFVKMEYETGHHSYFDDYREFSRYIREEYPDIRCSQALFDFYIELQDLGPSGFYEEYKDKFTDWDPDFVLEYGEEDEEL